ncbi:uncharacterized protein LOC118745302 [Rhagoletis pomonella]|uniref:uncharacterized protein LOC118745302 n=1 Tax=Rhagoletis pomonella TaxID=28610 RepID=UPI001785D790|nr:uncharacterized protein LOC118745302 [Rhagoletis pomonella]
MRRLIALDRISIAKEAVGCVSGDASVWAVRRSNYCLQLLNALSLQVCKQWYNAFYLPMVWHNFVVDDRTLTRAKYNYYSGWQYCLDHIRTQNCLSRVGKYMRGLEFRPEHSFNNIFQFMTMLSWGMEKSSELKAPADLKDIGTRIRSLVYVFPCNMSQANDPEGIKLFGTGGQLLKGLKELLSKLRDLRTLKLIDFVLERFEAKHLLDEVLESCCTKMRVLNLVNVTTTHCPIMHVGLFINLQVLTISPQNIDDDVLLLLADTKLKHLHLLQNRYTSTHLSISPCSVKAWRQLKRDNPKLKVYLRVESMGDGEVVFQPEAPVYCVSYESPKSRINVRIFSSKPETGPTCENTLPGYAPVQQQRNKNGKILK